MFSPRPCRFLALPVVCSGLLFAAALTGCGIGTPDVSGSGTLAMRGVVMGGNQPVSSSNIYMYTPGAAIAGPMGYGSASSSILLAPVQTDSNGNFNLTGKYLCSDVNARAYMVAVGGNPGLTAGTDNPALVMMTALGRCGDLYTTQYVQVSELTTVAAAWALNQFYKSYDHIGTSATNVTGLTNAFANASLLVDPHTGQFPVLDASLTVEKGKLNALANSLASCVNTNGSGGACTALFAAATPSGGSAPTNTMDAAINVVRNPGRNVAAVYNATTSFAPFQQLLSAPPNDWTMTLTVTGGGINSPEAVGLDANGTVWVAELPGALSGFTPQGTALSATGFGTGVLSQSFGLAITPDGTIWVTNREQPARSSTAGSVVRFASTAYSPSSQSPGTLVVGSTGNDLIDYPVSVSADSDNGVFVANYANSTASKITGSTITGGYAVGYGAAPVAIATDSTHGAWLANIGDNSVAHFDVNNNVLAHPACCGGAQGIAVDAAGNAWVADYYGTGVSEVTPTGTVTLMDVNGGGVVYPTGVAIDGAQDVWITNYRGASISKLAGNSNALPAGTGISPAGTGYGRDAKMSLPYAIAINFSGDAWVTSTFNNKLVEFIGIATPTRMPMSPTPALP